MRRTARPPSAVRWTVQLGTEALFLQEASAHACRRKGVHVSRPVRVAFKDQTPLLRLDMARSWPPGSPCSARMLA